MDSKPFRPRGAEIARPPLHQRHKSTGNIASMANASVAGIRGPAKRAAFGDVTNMSRTGGIVNNDKKLVKMRSSAALLHTQPVATLNKENVPFSRKEAFLRPAQRSAALSTIPQALNEVSIPEFATEPAAVIVEESVAAASTSNIDISEPLNAATVKSEDSLELQQPSGISSSLQPRHHKSQPYLKAEQPTLRRTQSRQLETSQVQLEEGITRLPLVPLVEEQASAPEPEVAVSGMPLAELPTDAEPVCPDDPIPTSDHALEILAKFTEASSEEVASSIALPKDVTAPQSEPEEYWDDEDYEDYDDQDQGYTTAHSFKSRDLTSGGATTVLMPRLTSRVQRELEEAKIEVDRTRSRDDIEEELWDVSMVAEYGEEIFEYMRELEVKMLPNPHYMDIQTEIQWSMRSVLMDWLVQVHGRFSLLPETLFLTVNYIDRFLSNKVVSIGKLQLVGATAILVASKYEEINCPSLQEIVYMVDRGYTMDEILKAERFMLSMLGFELGWPGPMSFLRRVSKADDYDLDTRTLAKYFLELTIMDERFVASPPSFLAAGAHCLSRLILNKGDWTKAHIHYSGYTWAQLRPLVSMMIGCCERPELHHAAVFEKYREKRFKEASLIVQDALDAGFTVPAPPESGRRSSARSIRFTDAPNQAWPTNTPAALET